MAGESPDRSKQRESSAEQTSGSAGPVPEKQDPRLAVARGAGGSGSGRKADTSTRVLSVREVSASTAEDAGADAAERRDEGAQGGDGRLREAVAAWVRSADPKSEDASGGASDASGADGDERDVEAAASDESPREGGSSREDARSSGDAAGDDAPSVDDAPSDEAATAATAEDGEQGDGPERGGPERDASKGEASEGATGKGAVSEGATGKGAVSEGATGKGAVSEDEDTESRAGENKAGESKGAADKASGRKARAGVAAAPKSDRDGGAGEAGTTWGRGGADGGEADAEETGKADDAKSDTRTDGGKGDAEADDGKREEGAALTDGGKRDESGVDGRSGGGEGTGRTAAGTAAAAKTDADAETEAEVQAGKGNARDGDGKTDGGKGTGKTATAATGDAKTADAKSTGETAAGAATAAKDGDAGTGDATTDGGERDPKTPDAERDGETDGAKDTGETAGTDAPVDQPTAVFRAPRPAGPEVDQPTTMLKLGDAAARTGGRTAEAERTSKFVALKPDPAIGQPPRQGGPAPAESTTFLPQVGPERTTQQPLPPKPPLDLLAELTNTPPPPQTPLRTAVRRIKIWTPLVILLVIVFAIVQNVRPLPAPTLALTAEDTYTFDGDQVKLPWPDEGQGWMSGDGIGTMDRFGEQKPVAIGSVAKTMTAYIILRDHPLKPGEEGPKIEVDAKAEEEGGYDKAGESTLNTVEAGDFLTEKQALSAVMIPSANNIARLLARWDAGSEEAFVKKMNDTAKELGMTNTTYTDPSGLKETTVSTAEDQTKLGIAAMRNPAMVAITSAASWTDPSGQYWSNYNELPYTMGAIGIKTGSTTKAGGNLLFAARKKVGGEEVTVVGAILGQHKGPSILDTVNEVSKPALRAAQDALTSANILKKGTVVGYVDDGLGGRTPVAVTEDVKAVGWAGLEVELTFAGAELPHTAKAGTKVGTLTVGDGENGAVKVPVALKADLVEPGFTDKLTRVA
ncbi:D-alanyl-D-alanine carboxypeptidase [Streptomyces variabilis]|uniref:serine-type D-Ala-D-Ala carboxypeptidase n=1 Tax=Streptomyces variabilis TaxID=67372 RepID=A0ABQ2U080_9ACTN|nr:D-alanyl-D-alanine carboxypeptidase [Streptomyces variabilis]GGP58760.1 D-alanyl-D-alanine carboxypeptidase [Streptomyces griseoincarnatus]GGT53562.1 D-alanyl-D-alanine carboxypeptidase [Streptomyces variabilis]